MRALILGLLSTLLSCTQEVELFPPGSPSVDACADALTSMSSCGCGVDPQTGQALCLCRTMTPCQTDSDCTAMMGFCQTSQGFCYYPSGPCQASGDCATPQLPLCQP
jgi:hypothetical protein